MNERNQIVVKLIQMLSSLQQISEVSYDDLKRVMTA